MLRGGAAAPPSYFYVLPDLLISAIVLPLCPVSRNWHSFWESEIDSTNGVKITESALIFEANALRAMPIYTTGYGYTNASQPLADEAAPKPSWARGSGTFEVLKLRRTAASAPHVS